MEEQGGKDRAEYGKTLVEELSQRLTKDFGRGFDKRNLWNMRKFYLSFQKVNALRSELTWTHYRMLLRVENEDARIWYMNEAANEHWSTRQLDRQIQETRREFELSSVESEHAADEGGAE